MRIRTQCPECQRVNYIEVREEDYNAWQEGVHIQNAFPNLSAAQREMLITGIDSACWNRIFEFLDEDGE